MEPEPVYNNGTDDGERSTTGSDDEISRRQAERSRSDSNSGDLRARTCSNSSVRARASSNASIASVPRSGSTASTISAASIFGSSANRASMISDSVAFAASGLSQLQEESENEYDAAGGNDRISAGEPSSSGEEPLLQIPDCPSKNQPSPRIMHPITPENQPSEGIDKAHNGRQTLPVDVKSEAECKSILNMPGEAFEVNTESYPAERNDLRADTVPLKSSLRCEERLRFIYKKICCHFEEVHFKDIERIPQDIAGTINSPSFFVEKSGYLMCLQVRLSTEHTAIGIAILQSQRDKSLAWPFNMMVLFRLLHLSGGEPIVKMFRCDKNSSKIKEATSRPKSAMNAPVGFPCFISRQRLLHEGFIKNNEMLVECYLFPRDAKIDQLPELPSIIK